MTFSVWRLRVILLLLIIIIILGFTAPKNLRIRNPYQHFEWSKDF
jgi:hypothetical protein